MATWQDVLVRDDVVGGYLETREGKDVYLGPIFKIEIDEDRIKITLDWKAITNNGKDWWKMLGNVFTTSTKHNPTVEGNKIKFHRPYFGETVIQS